MCVCVCMCVYVCVCMYTHTHTHTHSLKITGYNLEKRGKLEGYKPDTGFFCISAFSDI